MKRIVLLLLAVLLALLIVLIAGLGWLTGTGAGARWLLSQADQRVPALSIGYESGSLLRGLRVSGVAFESDTVTVTVAEALLDWSPSCLTAGRICVDRVELVDPHVRIMASDDPPRPNEARAGPSALPLPLPIRIDELAITGLHVETPVVGIELAAFLVSGGLGRNAIELDAVHLGGLVVDLPLNEAEAEALEVQEPDAPREPVTLPDVVLPFTVAVENLRLDQAVVRRGESEWPLRALALAARFEAGLLRLDRLELQHAQGELALDGRVRLRNEYPLALNLAARTELPQLGREQSVRAELRGSVAELRVDASAEGAFALRADAVLRPLQPALPFEVDVAWQRLSWPLEEPAAESLDGRLQVRGDLEAYRLGGRSLFRGQAFPEARLRLDGQGNLAAFAADAVRIDTLGGSVEGRAAVGWRDGINWSAFFRLDQLQPERFWPDYPGRLSGMIGAGGDVVDGRWSLAVNQLDVQGELLEQPFALSGQVEGGAEGVWRIPELQLRNGANLVNVGGSVGETLDLRGRFDLQELAGLYPPLAGRVSGDFAVGGPPTEPDVDVTARGQALQFQDTSLDEVAVRAQVRALGTKASSLQFELRGLQQGEAFTGAVAGSLNGTRASHRLDVDVEGEPASIALSAEGSLNDELAWKGRLLSTRITAFDEVWHLAAPLALAWLPERQQLAVDAHCWQRRDASLCLQEATQLGAEGEARVVLQNYRLDWLVARLPEGVFWDAPLGAEAYVAWGGESGPVAKLALASDSGTVLISQEGAPALELSYRSLGARLDVENGRFALAFDLESEQLGDADLSLQTTLGEGPRPLAGEVRLEGLQLALVQPFVPQLQNLAGSLHVAGRLGGTTEAPTFNGDAGLQADKINMPAVPLRIGAVELNATMAGQEGSFEGSFDSGRGSADISGSFAWGGGDWRFDAAVTGDRLSVVYRPLVDLSVSPDLSIRIRPQQVVVDGSVEVPSGEITLAQLPPGAVRVSSDVVVVRGPDHDESAGPPVPAGGDDWEIAASIELRFGDDVEISGYGLEGRLEGQLRIRQTPEGVAEAVGELRIEDGVYEAYGQSLEIRTGQLIFGGPISQPLLNVEAVRVVDDVVAGVRVTGEPEAPEVTLFSEPAMSQEEVLSYIIRGRPLGEGGEGDEAFLARAALAIGVFGGQRYASALAEEVGIEDFEIGTAGQGDDTQFQLSGYLNPRLYIQYGIGVFEPGNELTVRYRLTSSIYLEALSGLENAVDLFYEFEF